MTQEEEASIFIQDTLGNTGINWETLLPLTIIYTVFLVLGVCGNIATCIVIVNNEYMRTATNVYLLNLAITDIATLLLGNHLANFFRSFQHYNFTSPAE